MSHSMFCNTTERKPCDCHVSRRKPFGKTWFDTGKAHYRAGLVCDERYPIRYVVGYAYAAHIVGIKTYQHGIYPPFHEESLLNLWEADCGNDHSRGPHEAVAVARLLNWILFKRRQAAFERRKSVAL